MADIKLNDLNPAGSEFFADNEGYLSDLSEDEMSVWGGTGGVSGIAISGVDLSKSILNSQNSVNSNGNSVSANVSGCSCG